MREILFRGKTKQGDWVYGTLQSAIPYVYHNKLNDYVGITIFDWIQGGWCFHKGVHLVRKNTVGQFTGLRDKNNKMICEGDIVKTRYKEIRDYRDVKQDDYMEFIEKVIWSKDYNGFCLEINNCGIPMYRRLNFCEEINDIKLDELEVIGNIYDNPELLKER